MEFTLADKFYYAIVCSLLAIYIASDAFLIQFGAILAAFICYILKTIWDDWGRSY